MTEHMTNIERLQAIRDQALADFRAASAASREVHKRFLDADAELRAAKAAPVPEPAPVPLPSFDEAQPVRVPLPPAKPHRRDKRGRA